MHRSCLKIKWVTKRISSVFYFPYDWRLDSSYNAARLAEFIARIIEDTKSPKVDIVAHSFRVGLLWSPPLYDEQ